MEELIAALRAQANLMERLLFRMVAARRLLEAHDTRFVPWACDEIARAVTEVRRAEEHRAAVVARLACERGSTADGLTLGQLVESCDAPYSYILGEQRDTLRGVMEEIDEAAAGLVAAGLDVLPSSLRPADAAR